MTHQEAIARIEDHIRIHGANEGFRARHIQEALNMAVDALKAQEPRVMTFQDVQGMPEESVTWLELKEENGSSVYPFVGSGTGWYSCYCSANASPLFTDEDEELYGKEFRCWTAKPTEEQRKAVEWNE